MSSEKKISAPKHKIICDNTLDALRELPKESIDMVMTSPPYWGLRDYGKDTGTIWSGEKDCEHKWIDTYVRNTDKTAGEKQKTNKGNIGRDNPINNAFCSKCGAWHGQLGLEPTPELYIEHLRMVFVEIKRVLKETGTCWINIGDSYSNRGECDPSRWKSKEIAYKPSCDCKSLPPKCMVMIPERFAFMMIDSGYILRNKIIWHKPNSMPSSVKDRFNTTYEMLYFFSKDRKYWFDLDAVREEHKPESLKRVQGNWNGHREPMSSFQGMDIKKMCSPSGKNPGDTIEMSKEEWLEYCNYLWDLSNEYPDFFNINTQSFPGAHFAVFPTKLCERPILAGCPAEVCKHCGMGRTRIMKAKVLKYKAIPYTAESGFIRHGKGKSTLNNSIVKRETIGWTNCHCKGEDKYEPGIILDPFGGSGTISIEAEKLARSSIIVDIKEEYCKMALKRLSKLALQTKLDNKRSIIECVNF